VNARGRLRLDALARHLQDVATEDTRDAGIGDPRTSWVVRRTAVHAGRWPRYLDRVSLASFCSGLGPRWAERRTSMRAAGGAASEEDKGKICNHDWSHYSSPLSYLGSDLINASRSCTCCIFNLLPNAGMMRDLPLALPPFVIIATMKLSVSS
ncbi:MAG: hypothetical protein JOZ29_02895, partial [Deltaproteobacteria bacterium]|nr:hypothetical protein [Deltaproteobacteria bacterium]